ncbi:MAG TPA: heterodisulfide reductase-related iron-sulfur binding cluster [Acidimicrobiales bacterium]|jgi:Fe-S oxidoreductase|nr:heterodisulfide reductase-related iron-sulfur binding cluster [Acidimicrobiales bacterium]
MTTTYDPGHPKYFEEPDLRVEMERVFDLCHGCRLCFNLCPSFPTLFSAIDARDGDVGAMTTAEQDQVVDECYQCKLCYIKCPYVPPHEWELDFPRLMMRAHAVRHADGIPLKERVTDQFLARTDLLGKISTKTAPLVNAMTGRPGSFSRRMMEKTVGMASERLLPPYARQRFTSWFKRRRPSARATEQQGAVSVFPTCFIEYMEPDIGKDLVKVYEHNGVACSLPEGAKCCGAPWLHQGNIKEFTKAAEQNVAVLANEVRAGKEIIVSQPTCAYVVRKDYPIYLAHTASAADANLVAEHVADPAEYLMALHKAEGTQLATDFPGRESGAVPDQVTYHVACHLQAQQIGLKSRDLLKVAGVGATLVQRCSGIDGTWGYRAENYELARQVAQPLKREVEAAGNPVVCGDCHLANGSIEQETGTRPVHPIQLMARAYGIPAEGDDR